MRSAADLGEGCVRWFTIEVQHTNRFAPWFTSCPADGHLGDIHLVVAENGPHRAR